MNHETNSSSSNDRLTRRQKLLRRALPLILLTTGTAGATASYAFNGEAPERQTKQESHSTAAATAQATGEFGASESGWGIGSAQHLLRTAVLEGAVTAYSELNNRDGFTISQDEVEEIVKELPTFEQAKAVLNEAGYSDIMPEIHDTLEVEVKVEVDTSKKITYNVVDAHIEDSPDNWE